MIPSRAYGIYVGTRPGGPAADLCLDVAAASAGELRRMAARLQSAARRWCVLDVLGDLGDLAPGDGELIPGDAAWDRAHDRLMVAVEMTRTLGELFGAGDVVLYVLPAGVKEPDQLAAPAAQIAAAVQALAMHASREWEATGIRAAVLVRGTAQWWPVAEQLVSAAADPIRGATVVADEGRARTMY